MQLTESKQTLLAWLAAFSLVALGGKLWTIQLWMTNIPYWDQWDEARQLFVPWLDGTLTWRHLFQPHNEHRIVFTRLLDLLLIQLNGQWDIALQTVVNAGLHLAYGCGLIAVLWQFIGRRHAGLISCAVLPLFALPFAAENTIHGFQSQFYFANLFSLAAIVGLGFGQPGRALWWGGFLAAVLAIFTIASGFLAAVAVIGLVGVRALRQRQLTRGDMLTASCALAVLTLGWSLKVNVAQHAGLAANSAGLFFSALASNLVWPFASQPLLLPLAQLPLVIMVVKFFRGGFQNSRAAELVLVLGGWAGLQAAALAFARAGLMDSSRYLDSLSALTLANVAALFVLATQTDVPSRLKKILPLLAVAWVVVNVYGQVLSSRNTITEYLEGARGWGLAQTETLQTFMTTKDVAALQAAPRAAAPYWSAELLAGALQHPKLATILPAEVFPPGHALRKNATGSAVAQLIVNQAVWILLVGILSCLALAIVALRKPEMNFFNAGLAWMTALVACLALLAGVWHERGLNRDTYAAMLHQRIAFIYGLSGRPADAATHWRAALRLQPENFLARRELEKLSPPAALSNSIPSAQ